MPAEEPALPVSNRGYRYGDGLFETIKVLDREIALAPLHFDRLFHGLSLLKMKVPDNFTIEKLTAWILALCEINNCDRAARVRLSVSGGNGGLYDSDRSLQYAIECWPLEQGEGQLNENGLIIDIYPDAKKYRDLFSNLKSASFLLYSMAATWARENKLNDCLVLNDGDGIADSTIANIFIIKKGELITPPLSEGCIDGVMRKFLLQNSQGHTIVEKKINIPDLLDADEVFLTNAIKGIRWVKQFREKTYTNSKTADIFESIRLLL